MQVFSICAVGIDGKAQNSFGAVAPSSTAALPVLSDFGPLWKDADWDDKNPPEWRIIIQPGFVPFLSAGFRFVGFAWTSDFQADRHSGRSVRGCRSNGFSISPAAFSRIAVFCRQARRRRISTDSCACAEFSSDSGNARSGRNDGARKYLSRHRKAGTNFRGNFIPKTG